MRSASFTLAALLLAVPLMAPAPAHAGMIGPIQAQTADETASAVDTAALRHHHHRHVRHRRARHHHAHRRMHHG